MRSIDINRVSGARINLMESLEPEMDRVVDAWLIAEQSVEGTPEHDENSWAWDLVTDWRISGEGAENLWEFVQAAYTREMPSLTFAVLAAGPLEDLLADFGRDYIERIETLARKDPKFNELLGGVWKNAMSDEVWDRVQAIRNKVW